MDKYRVWYTDGKDDYCGDMTAEEVIAEYTNSWKQVETVTVEMFEGDKYIGEYDISWKEFIEEWG